MGIQQLLLAAGVTVTDPFFANVVALLHFDGSNGSTTITDEIGHSFTSRNGAALSTAQKQFGPSSVLLDGVSQSIDSPDSPDWNFGSGDFTIECAVRPAAVISARQDIVVRFDTFGYGFYFDASGVLGGFAVNTSGTVVSLPLGPTTVTDSVWHHVAFVRDGGVLRSYLDGIQQSSAAVSGSLDPLTTSLFLGTEQAAIRYLNGNMDELRITKGVCRYPGGTTFAPPSAAYPNS